ncbi:ABC-type branched-chain amino acid transport system, substrate-binding protein [Saccharopolyspora kobensis]|uniref:ABC-type branched-chain amino acid transport system, substrate-binding protein n=1 Tax=Saccharopolyspora kobensis TaxID=146035 RepID=A0A1H6DRN8_9PSEU|nr:substrate-binding domain-containing protein [Saccharopolyspora kobensis]SEG87939.1 ABC-type branched-chain amino acid transport system, substrate-binding protein [Saccharopolyspora kobensis]SFE04066.1 ABC-type branched-chain amino acid transport system, substrate-binding protein [Saccharopolyspora kobensis]
MTTGPALRERTAQWRVGMVIPLRGPAGLFGPSCEAITELAVHELNGARGILGREVAVEIVDGGAPPHEVAAEVRRLVERGAVDAVSGWHISSVRHAIAPVVAGRVPYVYTSLYEGGERRAGIFCSGETPRFQIAPALRWLRDNLGVRRWFVVGDDYVWPHGSTRAIRTFAHELDLRITGETYVGLGSGDMRRVTRQVAAAPCDGVLMLLVGQDAVRFNRAFAAEGLHDRLVRFSPLMEESMLLASGAHATRGLFVAAGYFRSLATGHAMDLLSSYVRLHGPSAPPLNNAAESCYEGLHALAELARRADSPGLAEFNAAIDGTAYEGPRGTVEFRGQQAAQHVHLAVADGYDFDVITRL